MRRNTFSMQKVDLVERLRSSLQCDLLKKLLFLCCPDVLLKPPLLDPTLVLSFSNIRSAMFC
jgi:hypothetical protein